MLVGEPWGGRIVTPLVLGLSVNVEIFFFFFGVIILEPSKKKKKKHAEGMGHSTTLGTALVTPQGTRVPLSPCYLQALGQVLLLPSAMLWVED